MYENLDQNLITSNEKFKSDETSFKQRGSYNQDYAEEEDEERKVSHNFLQNLHEPAKSQTETPRV